MKCPKCSDARTYVSTSKPHESGGVYRYRKCSGCSYNFTTMETVYDEEPRKGRPIIPDKPIAAKKEKQPKPPAPAALPKLKQAVPKKDVALIKKMRREIRNRFEDLAGEEDDWYA